MKQFTFALLILMLTSSVLTSSAWANKQTEKIIHDYLMNNPEAVMKIIQNAVETERAKKQATSKQALDQARGALRAGNVATITQGKGDLTLVEFFDYQCGYCKKAHSQVRAALAKDKNVRFILKEFPILGEASTLASKAAIAARKQGKYQKLHNALLSTPGRLSQSKLWQIAKAVGLDVKKLQRDMQNKNIDAALYKNRNLAEKLGINGTPSFIIFNDERIESISGVRSEDELIALFNKIRG